MDSYDIKILKDAYTKGIIDGETMKKKLQEAYGLGDKYFEDYDSGPQKTPYNLSSQEIEDFKKKIIGEALSPTGPSYYPWNDTFPDYQKEQAKKLAAARRRAAKARKALADKRAKAKRQKNADILSKVIGYYEIPKE